MPLFARPWFTFIIEDSFSTVSMGARLRELESGEAINLGADFMEEGYRVFRDGGGGKRGHGGHEGSCTGEVKEKSTGEKNASEDPPLQA
jgi:hypothetical protein